MEQSEISALITLQKKKIYIYWRGKCLYINCSNALYITYWTSRFLLLYLCIWNNGITLNEISYSSTHKFEKQTIIVLLCVSDAKMALHTYTFVQAQLQRHQNKTHRVCEHATWMHRPNVCVCTCSSKGLVSWEFLLWLMWLNSAQMCLCWRVTTAQKFGLFFNTFERSLLCSPRLYDGSKSINIVKMYYNLKLLKFLF